MAIVEAARTASEPAIPELQRDVHALRDANTLLRKQVEDLRCRVQLMQPTVADLKPTVADLQPIVAGLYRKGGRQFLGYGPFQTTAGLVALFVAGYTLVPESTGLLPGTSASELSVYRRWRTAILFLVGWLGLFAWVTAQQLQAEWRGRELSWLLALMVAPWAPVAGNVGRTIRATRRVRRMVRDRGTGNRLAAVLREFLHTGEPCLATDLAAPQLGYGTLSPTTLRLGNNEVEGVASELKEFSVLCAGGLPLAYGCQNRGPQSRLGSVHKVQHDRLGPIRGLPLWRLRLVEYGDPLLWLMSRSTARLLVNPFPRSGPDSSNGRDSSATDAELDVEASETSPNRVAPLSVVQEDIVLDAIDLVQPGGTMTEHRVEVLKHNGYCDLCIMAARATVEAFLESSTRLHEGVHQAWLNDVCCQEGDLVDLFSVLKDAVFIDHDGKEVPGAGRCSFHFLVLLFFLARSVLVKSPGLADVKDVVDTRLDGRSWAQFLNELGSLRARGWQEEPSVWLAKDITIIDNVKAVWTRLTKANVSSEPVQKNDVLCAATRGPFSREPCRLAAAQQLDGGIHVHLRCVDWAQGNGQGPPSASDGAVAPTIQAYPTDSPCMACFNMAAAAAACDMGDSGLHMACAVRAARATTGVVRTARRP